MEVITRMVLRSRKLFTPCPEQRDNMRERDRNLKGDMERRNKDKG